MLEWHTWVGNLGVLILIATYFALQIGKISSAQVAYSTLNALGAGLILFSLLFAFNLAAFLIEVFWVLISFIGIVKYFRSKPDPN